MLPDNNNNFEKIRSAISYLIGGSLITCIGGVIIGFWEPLLSFYMTLFGVLCLLAVIFIIVFFLHCPYCGKRIFRKVLVITHCPHCGRNLSTGEIRKKGKKNKKNR
ncbi:MAG: hypothetical protein MJ067_06145 [Oscillospiraceae bacterium]|nr:hypothetical protein [Oscillospiraceae bacterium]